MTLLDAGRCEQGPYLVLELLRGRTLGSASSSEAGPARGPRGAPDPLGARIAPAAVAVVGVVLHANAALVDPEDG